MTIRAAFLAFALLAALPIAGCCCLHPWGNAASWSFATKRPREADLIGEYRVQPFLSGGLRNAAWPNGRLTLTEDGRATLASCPHIGWFKDSPNNSGGLLDAAGSWKVVATNDGYFEVEIQLDSRNEAGQTLNLIVWHNSPKHKLWTQIGDPDEGDGIRFVPIKAKQVPKSESSTPAP